MNLSNTSQYAIRAICYMALKQKEIYSASSLTKELKVSDKYLKRILTTLSNNNLIKSVQGRYGGFTLYNNYKDINLYDIVRAVDNTDKYSGCVLGFDKCSDENPCPLHEKWSAVRDNILTFFKKTHISDVMKNPGILKL